MLEGFTRMASTLMWRKSLTFSPIPTSFSSRLTGPRGVPSFIARRAVQRLQRVAVRESGEDTCLMAHLGGHVTPRASRQLERLFPVLFPCYTEVERQPMAKVII